MIHHHGYGVRWGLPAASNVLKPIPATSGGGAPLRSRQVGSLVPVSVIEDHLASSLKCSLDPVSVTKTMVDQHMY